MADPTLQCETVKIRKLVADYKSGHVVIPEFQRDYVWKKSKAPKLLDSLYRQYPISSLLVWTSTDNPRERRPSPRPARSGRVSWLIDGQQRLITISKIIDGDDGIYVVFHPEREEFRLENAATKNDPSWQRVANIFDDNSYREIRRDLERSKRGYLREARLDKLRHILEYEISLVRMVGHSFENAVDAFTRINTLGARLKLEDIESAKVAAKHSGFIANEVTPFLDKIRSDGYSRLNVMHLFKACAFVAKPDGRKRTPFHELSEEEMKSAWVKTRRATEKALSLVQSEFGLVNMDILWSGALLVPIYCAVRANSAQTIKGQRNDGMDGVSSAAASL